ncbi:U-box domain-containing protein 26-like [Lolium rigidum]|uniref:U-box domain-containing protein 26-like n=1 Tax=Lolium rigidum TaxID=89674 RepID=UPI001F5DEEE5|nr:U-box domain-containing protein 26-like [Lolium rigidum]
MSIPHLFRCPISLDIFTDPVTLCTGQTYDRQCIERWLADGHRTCPVTMQALGDATALVPNRTLRHLIDRWLSAATTTDQHHHLPDSDPSLAVLKRCLLSDATAATAKIAALEKVMALASESDVGRACMLQLGFLSVLLPLVFRAAPADRPGRAEKELALQCALSLMPSNAAAPQLDCLNVLKKEASLASFVRLLERGSGRAKAGLCRLLETIATAAATRDLALIVAASPRVWQALLPLLQRQDGPAASDPRASEAAVRAIAAVCAIEPARGSAIHHGVVGALFRHLTWWAYGKGGGAVSSALAAVEALAETEAGRRAVARAPGATRVLVRHVFMMSSANDGSEHAAAALLAVCRESRAARSEAVGAGVVTQLLLLLQSQCGARAKAKARALLKLLKSR